MSCETAIEKSDPLTEPLICENATQEKCSCGAKGICYDRLSYHQNLICRKSSLSPTLYEECQLYIAEAILVYLYSKLRELSSTGYTRTPFEEFALPCDVVGTKKSAPSKGHIVLSALLELRLDEPNEGLAKEVQQTNGSHAVDPSLLAALDDLIEISLKEPGNPVPICGINAKPFAFDAPKHQHVGTTNGNLCSKYGFHSSQVLIDHLLTTEKEKQEKEAREAPLRKNKDNFFVKYAKHFLDIYDYPDATKETLSQDEQIIAKLKEGESTISWLRAQFHPDSPMGKLLDPSIAIVWTNDRFPEKECVYLIAVNKKEQKIVVIFRGTVTIGNILADVDAELAEYPNPISRSETDKTIELHHGIAEYLLRKRLDNGKTKYDEIMDRINQEAAKHFGDGTPFRLVLTGHSMGGALATLFGFYASADEKKLQYNIMNEPIRIFSYSSNMIGGVSFCQAFARQEQAKKLYHIRVSHVYDIVPRIPDTLSRHSSGTQFFHTGINIELPEIVINELTGSKEVRGSIKIKYLDPFLSFWQFVKYRIFNFVLFNLPVIWKLKNLASYHKLSVNYESLALSHRHDNNDDNDTTQSILDKTLEEVYDELLPPQEEQESEYTRQHKDKE